MEGVCQNLEVPLHCLILSFRHVPECTKFPLCPVMYMNVFSVRHVRAVQSVAQSSWHMYARVAGISLRSWKFGCTYVRPLNFGFQFPFQFSVLGFPVPCSVSTNSSVQHGSQFRILVSRYISPSQTPSRPSLLFWHYFVFSDFTFACTFKYAHLFALSNTLANLYFLNTFVWHVIAAFSYII